MSNVTMCTDVNPKVQALRNILINDGETIAKRFKALFALKSLAVEANDRDARDSGGKTCEKEEAVLAIADALDGDTDSVLLKHELAYCLGQTNNQAAIPALVRALENFKEHPMCRHEAAEALGAIGDLSSLDKLRMYRDNPDEHIYVRETCELAVARIEWLNSVSRKQETLKVSDFTSIDPAPPLPKCQASDLNSLEDVYLDPKKPLFERYRAMFALRDLASPPELPTAIPAVEILARGFSDSSALFRHEVAFVFGQLSHPSCIPSLTKVLQNVNEVDMVRHEAAEALGSMAHVDGVVDVLNEFLHDSHRVVRESVELALDMPDFESCGQSNTMGFPQQTTISSTRVVA